MEAKHTPGPWMVTEGSDWGGMGGVSLGIDDAFGQDGGRNYHLATVVHGDPDVLQANARLIAAAPELLEALQRLSAQCDRLRLPGQPQSAAEKNALEVITKATQ